MVSWTPRLLSIAARLQDNFPRIGCLSDSDGGHPSKGWSTGNAPKGALFISPRDRQRNRSPLSPGGRLHNRNRHNGALDLRASGDQIEERLGQLSSVCAVWVICTG